MSSGLLLGWNEEGPRRLRKRGGGGGCGRGSVGETTPAGGPLACIWKEIVSYVRELDRPLREVAGRHAQRAQQPLDANCDLDAAAVTPGGECRGLSGALLLLLLLLLGEEQLGDVELEGKVAAFVRADAGAVDEHGRRVAGGADA